MELRPAAGARGANAAEDRTHLVESRPLRPPAGAGRWCRRRTRRSCRRAPVRQKGCRRPSRPSAPTCACRCGSVCPPGRCRPHARPARRGPARTRGCRGSATHRPRRRTDRRSGPCPARCARTRGSRANDSESSVTPSRCTSAPVARKNIAVSSPIVPGPMTNTRSPGTEAAARAGAEGVAAGLHESAEHGVDAVREEVQRRRRDREVFGQRASATAADPHLGAAFAHVLHASSAAAAGAVTEHGVAHHASAEPCRVHTVADRFDDPTPFVAEAHRIVRVALVQVGHVAGEELRIGAADADTLHRGQYLAVSRRRGGDVLHATLAWPGQHIRLHTWRSAGGAAPRAPTMRSTS